MSFKVLITCPPMLGMIESLASAFEREGMVITAPRVVQILPEAELKQLVPEHDGWIIGDDPATRAVFTAGKAGRLRAAVKWGIGVDNVDFDACKDLGIPITNTPNMFGGEVADVAMGYVIALARETFQIDAGVRSGGWPKPRGMSLAGKTMALIGYGNIGKSVARRALAADMKVIAYDPTAHDESSLAAVQRAEWPGRLGEADFIVITAALTPSSHHMLDARTLAAVKPNVRVVNVGRGPIIHEASLVDALKSGSVYSAALDVFETEPLPMDSYLRAHPRCVFGSHNSSNTADAVARTSTIAIEKLAGFLRAQ